jgi:prepilin-type N-terminal cleavage/methylation domain-containing protein
MALRITKKLRGFTLIEMLVVISIFGILTSVVIANLAGLGATRSVRNAKGNLVSDLRRMQSASLSSKDINGTPSASYGVRITSVGTALGYDLVGYDKNSATRVVLESHNLPGAYIKTVQMTRPGGTTTTATAWEGLFLNPFGRLAQTYSGGSVSMTNDYDVITVITISSKDSSATSTITINGITGGISE